MATLGIVELFVFLLLKYYTNINKERKDVFGDVHPIAVAVLLYGVQQADILLGRPRALAVEHGEVARVLRRDTAGPHIGRGAL